MELAMRHRHKEDVPQIFWVFWKAVFNCFYTGRMTSHNYTLIKYSIVIACLPIGPKIEPRAARSMHLGKMLMATQLLDKWETASQLYVQVSSDQPHKRRMQKGQSLIFPLSILIHDLESTFLQRTPASQCTPWQVAETILLVCFLGRWLKVLPIMRLDVQQLCNTNYPNLRRVGLLDRITYASCLLCCICMY